MSTEQLRRVLFWVLIAAASFFLLDRLAVLFTLFSTPLLLFGLAWLIALALRPIVDRITQLNLPVPFVSHHSPETGKLRPLWRVPRGLAVALMYIALFAALIFFVVSLVPVIGTQLLNVQTALPAAVNEVANWSAGVENELMQRGIEIDIAPLFRPDALAQQAANIGSTIMQQSLGLLSSIAVLVADLIIILILSFYMTLDGPRLATHVLTLLPLSWRDETRTLFQIVDRTFGGFLRAQIVQSFIYGVATALLMITVGLSDVALASLIAGALVLIPVVGGFFAMIPPLVIVLIESPSTFFIVLVGLLIMQQVLFNIVMPRIMGRIVGLHPLVVFAAILIGATLAGGWGVLFGIPIAGVTASVLQFVYLRVVGQRIKAEPSPEEHHIEA